MNYCIDNLGQLLLVLVRHQLNPTSSLPSKPSSPPCPPAQSPHLRELCQTEDAIDTIVRHLTSDSPRVQLLAAALLASALAHSAGAAAPAAVAAGAIPHLVALLACEAGDSDMLLFAARALELLADSWESCRHEVLAAGAVAPLVKLLGSCQLEAGAATRAHAAGVIWSLMEKDDDARAAVRAGGGIPALAGLLAGEEGEEAVVRGALGALGVLVVDGSSVR